MQQTNGEKTYGGKIFEHWKNKTVFPQFCIFVFSWIWNNCYSGSTARHAIMWSDGSLAVYQWTTDKDSFVVLSGLSCPTTSASEPNYSPISKSCLSLFNSLCFSNLEFFITKTDHFFMMANLANVILDCRKCIIESLWIENIFVFHFAYEKNNKQAPALSIIMS